MRPEMLKTWNMLNDKSVCLMAWKLGKTEKKLADRDAIIFTCKKGHFKECMSSQELSLHFSFIKVVYVSKRKI